MALTWFLRYFLRFKFEPWSKNRSRPHLRDGWVPIFGRLVLWTGSDLKLKPEKYRETMIVTNHSATCFKFPRLFTLHGAPCQNPGLQGWEKGLEKSKQLYMHHESQKSRLHPPDPLKAHAQLHLGQCSSIKKPSLECYLHILPQTNPSRLGVISWACVCHFAKKNSKTSNVLIGWEILNFGGFPRTAKSRWIS